MGRSRPVDAELNALRAEIRRSPKIKDSERPAQESADRAAHPAEPNSPNALEEQIGELGRVLSDYAESAEDIVAEHPLVLVGAAFLLGIAVGHLLKRD